jgi:hypothetical protein
MRTAVGVEGHQKIVGCFSAPTPTKQSLNPKLLKYLEPVDQTIQNENSVLLEWGFRASIYTRGGWSKIMQDDDHDWRSVDRNIILFTNYSNDSILASIPYLVVAFEVILILMVPTKRGFFDWEPALAYTVAIMLAVSCGTGRAD